MCAVDPKLGSTEKPARQASTPVRLLTFQVRDFRFSGNKPVGSSPMRQLKHRSQCQLGMAQFSNEVLEQGFCRVLTTRFIERRLFFEATSKLSIRIVTSLESRSRARSGLTFFRVLFR